MAAIDDLTAKVTRISTAVDNIRQDIVDIKNGLPASGGLTEAEVATLNAALDAVVTKAETLDAENPSA